jgi:MFS family permease
MKQLLHSGTTVWRYRDLRLAGPARALSVAGDEVALIALLLHVHDIGAGARDVMVLLASAAAGTIVAAPWAGRLADRADSRLLLVCSASWQLVACTALAFAGPLWLICALLAAMQVGQAVAGPTWQALVPRMVGEAEVGRAVGATGALTTLAAVAGAPLGGLLVGLGGRRLPLLVDAATFGVLGLVALAVRTRRGGRCDPVGGYAPAGPSQRRPAEFLTGVRVLRSDPLLWPMFFTLLAFVVVGEGTNVAEIFLVRDDAGGSATQYGLIGAVLGLGAATGSMLAGRAGSDAGRVVAVVVGTGGVTVGLLAAGLWPALPVLFAAFAGLGVGSGTANGAIAALLLTRSPEAARGQMLASVDGLARAASLGALALGGWAATLLGPARTFVLCGVGCVMVVTALVVRILPRRHASPGTLLVLCRDMGPINRPG